MYDLIIIGGGPAGSSAGRRAGLMGLNTLIIEKAKFPRYKPCGGAVSEQAMSYLDFKIPRNILEKDIFGARIHYKNKTIEKHKKDRIATLVVRSVFDKFLLDKAEDSGIDISIGEKVVCYEEKRDIIEVRTDQNIYKSKFLIIAEGAHGRFKLQVRRRDTKSEFGICVVTEIPADSETIDKYIHNAVDIHFGVSNFGYGWIFPLKNHFSVGIGGIAKDMQKPLVVMDKFLKQNGFTGEYKLKSHLIPAGGVKRKTTSSRTVLVGDAAGFVDSFTGEGIAYAIKSGQIGAEIIHKILFQENSSVTLDDYNSLIESEFGRNLYYSFILSKIMHRFPGMFFKIFTSNEDLIDKCLDVASLNDTYKGFVKWIIPRVPSYFIKSLLP